MEKNKIDKLPRLPGVYIFKNKRGEIIYIGKAKSIYERVKAHIASSVWSLKERNIMNEVESVDYITTPSEPEALLLESYLIKEKRPRYNINYKDDKSYPWVKITLGEEFPRVYPTRRKEKDGSLYLGPYPNVGRLRHSLKLLRSLFPYASCKRFPKSACLYFHINLCPAPCREKVDKYEYRKNILAIIRILLGDVETLVKDLTQDMDSYVRESEFEKAIEIREKIKSLGRISSLFGGDESLNVLENIKQKLNLPHLPRVIDAVDISNISGTLAVGSVVRFKDAQPEKQFYRRFKLKRQNFINDYEMMTEVVIRRYGNIIKNRETLPDLLLLDGGKGHLNKIDHILKKRIGLDLTLIAYAKGRDVIFSKYRKKEIKFSSGSSEKNLLIKIRNEAHRFAIGYHKLLRRKKAQESLFEEIPGIGRRKIKKILAQLDGFQGLDYLEPDDLKKIQGIGNVLAERISNYFKQKKDKEAS